MPCPFLNRLPNSYIRNYGVNLLKAYGNHCPVVSRLVGSLSDDSNTLPSVESIPEIDSLSNKCPFLAEVNDPIIKEASTEMKNDLIELLQNNEKEWKVVGQTDKGSKRVTSASSADKMMAGHVAGGGICMSLVV